MSNYYARMNKILTDANSSLNGHFRYLETFKPDNGNAKLNAALGDVLVKLSAKNVPHWVHARVNGYKDAMVYNFERSHVIGGTWHPEHGFLSTYKFKGEKLGSYYRNKMDEMEFYEFVKAYGTGLFYAEDPTKVWFAEDDKWIRLHMAQYQERGK